jgi:hypothetical protein
MLLLHLFIIITIIEHWKDIKWSVYFWLSSYVLETSFNLVGLLFHPINQCDVMHIMTLIIITTTSVLNVTTYITSYMQ